MFPGAAVGIQSDFPVPIRVNDEKCYVPRAAGVFQVVVLSLERKLCKIFERIRRDESHRRIRGISIRRV